MDSTGSKTRPAALDAAHPPRCRRHESGPRAKMRDESRDAAIEKTYKKNQPLEMKYVEYAGNTFRRSDTP
jgi:hypothetical protein